MEAISLYALRRSVALMAGMALTAAAEEPLPLPLPMEASQLVQPAVAQPDDPRQQVRGAFELDPQLIEKKSPPPESPSRVRLASTNPTRPRGEALASLYEEAERLSAHLRSISDLTDFIEQCADASGRVADQDRTALDRLNSWACNRRGELLVTAGKPRDAFADFQHAIVLDNGNWSALHNRGVTLAEHGLSHDALVDFDRALTLHPACDTARRNRAELLVEMGRFDKAVSDYSAALRATPADASLYAGRAFAQWQLGRFRHAAQDYNASLTLLPTDANALAGRGTLYAELGYYEQAIADLDAALAADPASAPAYRSVAWLLATCPDQRFRDPQKALEAARRAVRFGGEGDAILLDVLAASHASAGQLDQAVRVQQQAVVLATQELKPELEARLALYRSGRPYRQAQAQAAASLPRVSSQVRR